jgi:hypothetical protein
MKLRWKEKLEETVHALLGDQLLFWEPRPGVWIAGGAARGHALNEKYSDIDFMFASRDIYESFSRVIGRQAILIHEREDLREYNFKGVRVQLCAYDFYDTAEEMLADFDFTLCKFALDLEFNLKVKREDYEDAINKVLRCNRLKYPVVVFRRIDKFMRAGYTPHAGFWDELVARLKDIENPFQHTNVGAPSH